jgi:hypothetical protein
VLRVFTCHNPRRFPLPPYTRSEIISEACIRATVHGGTIPQHASNVASERGVRLDPARPLP